MEPINKSFCIKIVMISEGYLSDFLQTPKLNQGSGENLSITHDTLIC